MILDVKMAKILSNFCADLAKAYFVATFITPGLSGITFSLPDVLTILTRGVLVVIILILLAWKFEKLKG